MGEETEPTRPCMTCILDRPYLPYCWTCWKCGLIHGELIPQKLRPWPSNDDGIPGDEILLAIELADVDLSRDVHDVVAWYWERGL